MKKGIYLAAFKALHQNHELIYQDINGKRDIDGDMMKTDLSKYDYIIATPPCNYWSKANYRRNESEYALKTMHLLPEIIDKLCKQDKPFIIENVRNKTLFKKYNLYNKPCNIYEIGRHTYWTNLFLPQGIRQKHDFKRNKNGNTVLANNDGHREGGANVHEVIEYFIEQAELI